MRNIASPLDVASVASALLWPLAAGVAVVLGARARAAKARRVAALKETEHRSDGG
jgi:hypothetical protein